MRQIVMLNEGIGYEFTWLEVGADKWEEEMWKKDTTEAGDTGWVLYHRVKYLTESGVKWLVGNLAQLGFVEV